MTQELEDDLVRRARLGDRAALSLLWRRHRGFLATVLLGHLPAGVDLEDLLQDIAVTVVRGIHRLEQPGALRGWLRAIALNVARDACRRQASPVRRAKSLGADGTEPADPLPERRRAHGETRQRLDRALGVIAGFHPTYREPLLLKCVHGLTQRQIAAALGVPVTAVESRLARARRMLRQEFAGDRAEAKLPLAGRAAAPRTEETSRWMRHDGRS